MLHEEFAEQPSRSATKREAHRRLTSPRRRASEQEVRDVGARQQVEQSDSTKENNQRSSNGGVDARLVDRNCCRRHPLERLAWIARQRAVDRRAEHGEFTARLGERDAGPKPTDNADEVLVAADEVRVIQARRQRRRDPDLSASGETTKTLPENADYGERDAVDANIAADERRVGRKPSD